MALVQVAEDTPAGYRLAGRSLAEEGIDLSGDNIDSERHNWH